MRGGGDEASGTDRGPHCPFPCTARGEEVEEVDEGKVLKFVFLFVF